MCVCVETLTSMCDLLVMEEAVLRSEDQLGCVCRCRLRSAPPTADGRGQHKMYTHVCYSVCRSALVRTSYVSECMCVCVSLWGLLVGVWCGVCTIVYLYLRVCVC